jgi:hypothetical protein
MTDHVALISLAVKVLRDVITTNTHHIGGASKAGSADGQIRSVVVLNLNTSGCAPLGVVRASAIGQSKSVLTGGTAVDIELNITRTGGTHQTLTKILSLRSETLGLSDVNPRIKRRLK